MGPDGSIDFRAAGHGPELGRLVFAPAFGPPFAPNAYFLTRRRAARPDKGDRCTIATPPLNKRGSHLSLAQPRYNPCCCKQRSGTFAGDLRHTRRRNSPTG